MVTVPLPTDMRLIEDRQGVEHELKGPAADDAPGARRTGAPRAPAPGSANGAEGHHLTAWPLLEVPAMAKRARAAGAAAGKTLVGVARRLLVVAAVEAVALPEAPVGLAPEGMLSVREKGVPRVGGSETFTTDPSLTPTVRKDR